MPSSRGSPKNGVVEAEILRLTKERDTLKLVVLSNQAILRELEQQLIEQEERYSDEDAEGGGSDNEALEELLSSLRDVASPKVKAALQRFQVMRSSGRHGGMHVDGYEDYGLRAQPNCGDSGEGMGYCPASSIQHVQREECASPGTAGKRLHGQGSVTLTKHTIAKKSGVLRPFSKPRLSVDQDRNLDVDQDDQGGVQEDEDPLLPS